MKNFILFSLLIIAVSCGTKQSVTENISGEFFERLTDSPYTVIDSIMVANNLDLPTDYHLWERSFYRDNEYVPVTLYVLYTESNNFIYIFSITQRENENQVLIKYRKEN